MNSFLLISATTHRHFDKLVTNTKYIGDKYETHWWQIQLTSVANTKYGVRKNKESAKLSDLAIKGKTSAALQFPATPGTMPLSTMENRHYATINYEKQRKALSHYGKQCTVVDNIGNAALSMSVLL